MLNASRIITSVVGFIVALLRGACAQTKVIYVKERRLFFSEILAQLAPDGRTCDPCLEPQSRKADNPR